MNLAGDRAHQAALAPRHRFDADPESVERGLVTLVLTAWNCCGS
jgi:hypothetical protein